MASNQEVVSVAQPLYTPLSTNVSVIAVPGWQTWQDWMDLSLWPFHPLLFPSSTFK